MQSSKEQQGEIRKASEVNSEKKQRKGIEWNRQDLFKETRKISRKIQFLCKNGYNKGQKWY